MRNRPFMPGFKPRHSAQALIEFALILPVMLIMVLGGIDLGRAFVYGVAAQDGAREAARLGASAAVATSVTDTAVLQRLIDASSPALAGCAATTATNQSCGGGTWTLAISVLTTSQTYTSIASAVAADSLAGCTLTGPVCQFPGSQLTVTATGQVSMLNGFRTPWGPSLFPITAQGQAVMVVL
jgi:Flp pilus assembly protein TadG